MQPQHALGTTPIAPLLARMAIPATVAMGTTALYNLVDTIFIGRWVGTLGIAGVSIAFPVQIIVLSIALLIGLGTASVVSRALGADDPERAARVVGSAAVAILVLSAIISVAGVVFIEPIMALFGATREVAPYTREYLSVIIPGSVFVAGSIAATHIVRSEGAARYSMRIMLLGAGLNILLDPIFIRVLDMGVRGAAIATVLAQASAAMYGLAFFLRGKSSIPIRLHHFRIYPPELMQSLSIGFPAFVRQVSQSVIIVLINNILAGYGDTSIAAFGLVHRVMIFSLLPLLGIGQGFQPIVGFNYGARQFDRVREAVKVTRRVAFGVALIPFFAVMAFAPGIASIFTTDAELIEIGSRALRIALLIIPLVALQIVGSIFFQAIGKAIPALFLSLSRQIIFLIPAVLILPTIWGRTGVWIAFPVADLLAVVVTVIWLHHQMVRLGSEDRDDRFDSAGPATGEPPLSPASAEGSS
jgi:putative MATE family efflux protein